MGILSTAEPLLDRILDAWGIEDDEAVMGRRVREGARLEGNVDVNITDDGHFQVSIIQRTGGVAVQSNLSLQRHYHIAQ